MKFATTALVLAVAASTADAFAPLPWTARSTRLAAELTTDTGVDPGLQADIARELNYRPGEANTEFARRYKHLVGKRFKTVGEAFADFTKALGYTVNPLYKNMVTDLVGTTHLIVVSPRFQRDAIWSCGLLTSLDLLLKNYPEPEIGAAIVSALFSSMGLKEAEVRAEAKMIQEWASGKSKEEIEAALAGEGNSPVAEIAKKIKADEFWQYSRYFGIGLLKMMELCGLEMDKDEIYPVMESWMGDKLGRAHMTACSDSDLYFKIKSKLDMMETMMKEIEIREKKRMAERLEEKAEQALRAAEREQKLQSEIEAEAKKNRERVES